MPALIIVASWRVRTAMSLVLTHGLGGPKSPLFRSALRRAGARAGARTRRSAIRSGFYAAAAAMLNTIRRLDVQRK
jgi:hypothetical protein